MSCSWRARQKGGDVRYSDSAGAVRRFWVAIALGLSLFLGGCGSGSSGASGSGSGGTGDAVAVALNKLGVDTTATNRKASTGSDLPSDYAPLGTTAAYGNPQQFSNQSAMNATDAVLVVGPSLNPVSSDPANIVNITGADVTGSTATYGTPNLLHNFAAADNPWIAPSGNSGVNSIVQSLSSVATGDLDGDGLQELVAAYVAPPASGGADPTLVLETVQDANESYLTSTMTIEDAKGITDVSVVTGDFSGNGQADIVLAVAFTDHAELQFLKAAPGGMYQVDTSLTKTLTPTNTSSSMYFRLAAGNLDYDRADELAVVFDEFSGQTGAANYYVYDDASTGFALLKSGPVEGTDGSGLHVAIAGDISFGDVDGDGVDEVVMGGPTVFSTSCNTFSQVVSVLDDAPHKFASLGATYTGSAMPNAGHCPGYNPWKLYFTFIKTVDLTGNGVASIVANQFIYDYSSDKRACPTGICARQGSSGALVLPDNAFFTSTDTSGIYILSPTRADMAVGDVTADGRQNVLLYVQWHNAVGVWGQSQVTAVGDDGWTQLSSIPTSFVSPNSAVRPQLVTTQTEPSGPVLKYTAGSHKLVFTQPIVVAALAAPPCQNNVGQNVSACVTTFGQSTSSGGSTSTSVSVTAGVTVGVEAETDVPFVGTFNATDKESIATSASLSMGTSYNVTKTVTYSTGSMKDGVIFTTVPYDQYTYTIASAADPKLVGKLVVISLPRTPITLIADRDFYNASVPAGALTIDSKVFTHAIGNVSSYPSHATEQGILGRYGGIDNGPKTVGEGSGSTQLSIDVNSQISSGASLGLTYTNDFETTGEGYVFGYSVGYGTSASLTITSGSSTSYTGTVGSIDSADYNANYYNFGLFTYVQPLDGQKFEVVNYWVTPQ